ALELVAARPARAPSRTSATGGSLSARLPEHVAQDGRWLERGRGDARRFEAPTAVELHAEPADARRGRLHLRRHRRAEGKRVEAEGEGDGRDAAAWHGDGLERGDGGLRSADAEHEFGHLHEEADEPSVRELAR